MTWNRDSIVLGMRQHAHGIHCKFQIDSANSLVGVRTCDSMLSLVPPKVGVEFRKKVVEDGREGEC